MAEEGAKAGMVIHGNEYHAPDFEQEGAAAALIEAHRTAATHTQDQPPAEHGNAKHNPDFEQEGVAASLVGTHEAKTTGIHGVGGSTVESASGAQGKVDTHEAKTTGVHGVGAGTVAKVGDIATDANLSAAAQDAISKKHTQNTDKIIKDADGDTALEVEQSADEDKIRGKVKGVEVFLLSSDGILTLAKQSYVRAFMSANQSIPNETYTKVTLDSEDTDRQGEFNTATYRFVAKEAGLYCVIANVLYLNNNPAGPHQYGGYIYLNGSGKARMEMYSPAVANNSMNLLVVSVLSLAVADYLEIYTWQGSGGARTLYGGSTGQTHLIVVKIA